MQKETNQLIFSTTAIIIVVAMWFFLFFASSKLEGILNERILTNIMAFSAIGGVFFIFGQIFIIFETVIRIIRNKKGKQVETEEESINLNRSMKEKIKVFLQQNWFKVSLLISFLIVIAGVFYWYEWRPTQIRKECYLYLQIGGGLVDEKTAEGLPSLKMKPVSSDMANEFYRDCLRRYGLEK